MGELNVIMEQWWSVKDEFVIFMEKLWAAFDVKLVCWYSATRPG
jgi:hypothetical protein